MENKKLNVLAFRHDEDLGYDIIELSEQYQYLKYAKDIFRGSHFDKVSLHMKLQTGKDVDDMIDILKTIKPCFNE